MSAANEQFRWTIGDQPPENFILPEPLRGNQKDWPKLVAPLDQLQVPEGYVPYVQRDGLGRMPMDWRGQLRREGEQWWDAVEVDGQAVPCRVAYMRGACHYDEPYASQARTMCCAWDRNHSRFCTDPVAECSKQHCQRWQRRNGRYCSHPRKLGQMRCRYHTQEMPNIALRKPVTNRKVKQITRNLYAPSVPADQQAMLDRIAEERPDTDLTDEVHLNTMFVHRALQKLQSLESQAAWLALRDEVQKIDRVRTTDELTRLLNEIRRLVKTGVDSVTAEEQVMRGTERLARIAKVKENIRLSKSQIVTQNELNRAMIDMITLVTETWANDRVRLASFIARVQPMVRAIPSAEACGVEVLEQAD